MSAREGARIVGGLLCDGLSYKRTHKMDSGQFQEYTNCLAVIEQNREKVRKEEKARAGKKEKLKALIKQTTVCDGSSTSAVRVWMKEVELSQNQLSPAHVIELVSQTVNGALRWELERYLKDYVETHSSVARDAVPWTELKEHLSASFLHVDEASALRDEVEKTAQSAYEPEAGYNRRFREVADAAYPVTSRNDDQHRILIRAYARGLKSSDLARKLMEEGAPTTLDEAIKLVAGYSARKDAYSRLSRTEEPMEIGALSLPPKPKPVTPDVMNASLLQKVLRGQEKLFTKLEKLQLQEKPTAQRERSRIHTQREPLRCFNCNAIGHFRANCTKPIKVTKPGNGWRS